MDNDIKISTGFSLGTFAMLLTIAFVVLKLCNVITWAWVWVLAPLWIYFALVIAIVLITLLIMGITLLITIIANR